MARRLTGPVLAVTERMFLFFTRKLGCAGSIVVSIIGTLLLVLLMRACSGSATY